MTQATPAWLQPRWWIVARDDERLAATLASLHFLAFACLMLQRFILLTLSL